MTAPFANSTFSYIFARTASVGLATLLALHYSKNLGPENRGVLSFITVTMLLLSEIFLNVLNLELRSTFDPDLLRSKVHIFMMASAKRIFIITSVLLVAAIIFSKYKSHLPLKLYVIFGAYILIALFTQQLLELLIAFSRIRISAIIEVSIVLFQVLIYCLLFFLTSISLIVIIFTSLIFSYTLISIIIAIKYRKDLHLLCEKNTHQSIQFLNHSKRFLSQTLSVSLLDRIDKILILLIFSVSDFGRYMVAASIFFIFRFIPEAIGKLILNRRLKTLTTFISTKGKLSLTLLAMCVLPVAKLGDALIRILLGDEWSLPFSLYVFLLSGEVVRFFVIVELNRRNILRDHAFAAWAPLAILAAISGSVFVAKPFLGIQSVPLIMCITYGIIFWILTAKLTRKPG